MYLHIVICLQFVYILMVTFDLYLGQNVQYQIWTSEYFNVLKQKILESIYI